MNSLINQTMGAASGVSEAGISIHASICLQTEFIMQTVSSYSPGESCVLCEVEKINKNFDKMLHHSLIQNKASGNLFESAKCKDAYQVPVVDIQFVAIAAPIPTPPGDEIINGKNILEEWSKFVNRYQPFGTGPYLQAIENSEIKTGSSNTETNTLLNSLSFTLAKEKSNAILELESFKVSDQGKNSTLFMQSILNEIRQMKSFFEGYNKLFTDISNVCTELNGKKQID